MLQITESAGAGARGQKRDDGFAEIFMIWRRVGAAILKPAVKVSRNAGFYAENRPLFVLCVL